MDGKWVEIAGKLIGDDRVKEKNYMLDHYPNLQTIYSADDDNAEVLYFDDAIATFSSFTEEPKVNKF